MINALYVIYNYDVNTLFYSAGCTELHDDTATNRGSNIYKRHMKNMKKIGFKLISVSDEDDIPLYAFNINNSNQNIFEDEEVDCFDMEENYEIAPENREEVEEIKNLFDKYKISDTKAMDILRNVFGENLDNFHYPNTDILIPISEFALNIEEEIKKYLNENKVSTSKVISIEDYKNNKED